MQKINIVLPLLTRPKKNSQNIIWNKNTGKPMIIQSKQFLEFEKMCKPFLAKYIDLKIDVPINLKCTFYVKDQRRRDICNFVNAIQDILVKYSVIEDDNYKIIQSIDGTRIVYRPKAEPETIIEITEYKE